MYIKRVNILNFYSQPEKKSTINVNYIEIILIIRNVTDQYQLIMY